MTTFIITPGERNVKGIKKESGELKVSASHNGFSLSTLAQPVEKLLVGFIRGCMSLTVHRFALG
jgi:hypothetical protein